MAGYIGYDPDALDRLVAAMRTAATELTQIRTTDIEAAGPIGRVRAAQATLETTWLPIVTGMRGCVALTGFTPTRLDGSDVRASELFVLQGYGWQIVTDPGGRLDTDTGPVTASEARAIAALLSSPRAQQLLDTDEERSWLSGRLERILADPRLAEDFRRNLDARSALAIIGDARFAAAARPGRSRQTASSTTRSPRARRSLPPATTTIGCATSSTSSTPTPARS